MKKADNSRRPTSFIDIPSVRILDVSVTDTSRSQWFQNTRVHITRVQLPMEHSNIDINFFSLLSLQQILHFFRPRSCFLRHANLVMSCAFSQNFCFGGRKKKSFHLDETLHQGRQYAVRRGLQIVCNVFSRSISASDGPSLFRWGHNEGRKQKVQLYWMYIFPPSAPFYSCLRPKCQVRCFCGYLAKEALETQHQPSKFLRLRVTYVGTTCVEIQWSFLSIVLPLGCSQE